MANKTLELVVGTKPAAEVAQDKIGRSFLQEPQGQEVGGRALLIKYMECWNCGGVTRFRYDTNAYHYYSCAICGATNGPF